jgi:hypothetical protein
MHENSIDHNIERIEMVIRKFIDEDIAEDGICEPIDNYKCVAY